MSNAMTTIHTTFLFVPFIEAYYARVGIHLDLFLVSRPREYIEESSPSSVLSCLRGILFCYVPNCLLSLKCLKKKKSG